MTKIKRLILISGIFLFAVLLFNLYGYIHRNEFIKQKETIEEAYYLATGQEVLLEQLARKISILSIHHFSPEQQQQQFYETIALDKRMAEQQQLLQNSFIHLPASLANAKLYADRAGNALQHIHTSMLTTIKNGPVDEEDHSVQANVRNYESLYISDAEKISSELRVYEKTLNARLSFLGTAMFVSLILGLILLMLILVFPVIKLNTQTYKELKRSLEEMERSRQLLLQSEIKYRQLFECSPLSMWIFDIDTLRFLEVNQRMLQLYGYSREELLHMTILDIRPQDQNEDFQKILATRSYNGSFEVGRWVHQKKNGEQFTAEIHAHKIQYQGKEASLVIANDLTQTLELQKQLVETKINHQRTLAKASLSVQEKERNQIGKELHDNVNQILTAVKLHLELIRGGTGENVHVFKSIDGVNTAIQEIRRLSGSLVPPTFTDMGLLHAIEDLTDNMNCQEKCSIQFRHEGFNESDYSADFKLTVFRIVQEQLTNIFKHARAKTVLVRLESYNRKVCISVQDDGVGFEKNSKKRGVGLTNIINRSDAFHGTVTIDTAPGKGCRLNVCFSMQNTDMVL